LILQILIKKKHKDIRRLAIKNFPKLNLDFQKKALFFAALIILQKLHLKSLIYG
jgi:hypothetical protein